MIVVRNGSLTVFRSALYKTTSSVIQTGDMVLVVDPCWLPDEVEDIRRHTADIAGGKPVYVLFTHSDYDHIIGGGAFPGARTIASAAFANKSGEDKEQIVEQIRTFEDEYYIERGYPIGYPDIDHVIERDGQTLEVGDTRLTFYLSPGHNPDGLYTIVEPLGYLLAGDYFSDIEFPYIYHDSRLYETSIGKLDAMMAAHSLRLLIPGHGAPTDDAGEMVRRQQKDLAYIAAMRAAVEKGDQAAIDGLIDGCPFPRNMRKFHRDNQRLFEREMNQ